MNNLVKTAVASALALGATSAFAIGVPSSNSSDLILYVDAVASNGTSAGVYALDTGISLKSLMPGPYALNTANGTTFPGTSQGPTPASSTLSNFLSTYSSDTIEWTLEGGQYNNTKFSSGTSASASNKNSVTPGSALAVFTSPALTTALPNTSSASTVALQGFLNGLQGDISTGGGISGLLTSNETTGTESVGAQSKYSFFGGSDLAATGSTAIDLFGFTGNGINGGTLQSYILGNATLSSTGVLTINPNTPVPLPAALWLLGSGVMGLVGVSRRRKAAATV